MCRKVIANPRVQRMADLPFDRVTPGKLPFSFMGVDCFGPFVVKRGRTQIKRYGCLFTCLTTRAVHIKKLDSLEADPFINGFVRFCARRGVPEKVRSGNGTNFVAEHAHVLVLCRCALLSSALGVKLTTDNDL